MDELKGLKALVTGGASGIGLAIATTFAAEEVAHAALYLASPRAGSTTGAEIAVDGGMAGLRLRPRP